MSPPETAENQGQYRDELTTGVPVALSPLIRRILAPNPGVMTGPGTNTYLIGHQDVTVIDPGPDDVAHIDAIVSAGAGKITRVLCTHTHIDHWPASVEVARRTGCEVLAFDARDGLEPTGSLAGGDVITTDSYNIAVHHTPGHASNHLCFLLVEERVLFSGDHIMQGSTVVISPPDGDMSHYLRSLDELDALGDRLQTIAPAHGYLLSDPPAAIAALRAHRLRRETIVAGALAEVQAPVLVDELVPAAYADVDAGLYPVARRSLWAHLLKLVDDGRATVDTPEDIDNARWAPT